ncbi:blr3499 [Bradyrhizobium diazoefficiens USDA 110]|uniref:Blr3499 protein n=2 Tax=Bradyrhizobium diazoefficiens TaxID=1355477 RepID=Q89PI1_BRADU|nr:TadE family protein [Bradyrhizobium diazoefficiens]AND88881.1 pilus assembly protein TadE [Bradyrhizobium diazoefficiens USDA 110]QHP71461.1 pilus assembly protein [Bradyrhizobium sp. LCT2]AWO90469.1 pilus assembly protein [Bradyrhizobium diazoefficiens]PDT62878.1 pilus assembly protein TadE [Bradyrhizobium diazoefficiens]QBP22285.1 pilus assembly protein [Bradyrhizobium diazoefficiens]
MMRKLDNRGASAFELILVFVPLFTLMFAIIDLGRYAITMQSLRTLASAGARAVMISCYTPDMVQSPPQSPAGCTGDPLSLTAKQNAAPFLYFGRLTPTLTVGASTDNLTVTASQAGFTMLMPIWGTALNAPSASTKIPF